LKKHTKYSGIFFSFFLSPTQITKIETVLSIFAFIVIPELSFSYPIFGTKRYHRANPTLKQPSSSYPVQYYDNTPQYYQSQYEGIPRYVEDVDVNYYPFQQPQAQHGLYGLPIYRGEYKPTTYYYAPGPSYTYSDDRVEPANPLDDIHEEMMQEDKLERSYGQDARRPIALANTNAAFLRNLIEYNNQINYGRAEPEPEYATDYGDYDQNDMYDQPNYNYDSHADVYQHNSPQETVAKYTNEREDENVKQLKKLSHHNNHNDDAADHYNYNWQQDTPTYDTHPVEYDDDQWINWDKRSGANDHVQGQVVSSIFSFSNRKPTLVVKPTESSGIVKPTVAVTKAFPGQKEVAQPVRHPFTAVKNEVTQEPHQAAPSGTIYDTIKKILDMEQSLEKVSRPEIIYLALRARTNYNHSTRT
jgi:hypothetical protein